MLIPNPNCKRIFGVWCEFGKNRIQMFDIAGEVGIFEFEERLSLLLKLSPRLELGKLRNVHILRVIKILAIINTVTTRITNRFQDSIAVLFGGGYVKNKIKKPSKAEGIFFGGP